MLQVRQSETKMHEEKLLLVQIHHLFFLKKKKRKEKSHKAVYSVKENMVISVWIFSKSN